MGTLPSLQDECPRPQKNICGTIKPNAPFGCFNGASIYDPLQEKYLWNTFLPQVATEVVEAVDLQLSDIGYQLNTAQEIYVCKDNGAMARYRAVTGVARIFCPYTEVKESVMKVVFTHHDPQQIELLKALHSSHPKAHQFDYIHSESHLYEILPKGVSKGAALCKLAQLLGIDMSKTITAGDYYNDVSMIKQAGLGFAVANAVEDAKAAADYISVSNNDHAIAQIIDGLDRGIFAVSH